MGGIGGIGMHRRKWEDILKVLIEYDEDFSTHNSIQTEKQLESYGENGRIFLKV
jgi:hypothetical protein